jgi:hypothetical protein
MEDFTASVQDLTRKIEQRQRQLQESLALEKKRGAALQALLQRMQAAPDAFDEEDRKAVQQEAAARDESLRRLQTESERQDVVRREKEKLFLHLHRALQQRSALLEAADSESGVLAEHDGLLRFFAQKQLTLTNLLREKMKELA